MNKFNISFKSLVLLAAAANSSSLLAQNYQDRLGCVGVDLLYSSMKMSQNWGGNVFAKSAPGINFYFGKQFHEYFGAEVGSEFIKNKTKYTTITNAQTIVFNAAAAQAPQNYKTAIKITKPYLGVTSTFFINNNSFVQLLVGASIVKIKSYSILVSTTNLAGTTNILNQKDVLNKNKVIPTLKVSFGANVFDDLGIKASFSWTNTKSIKQTRSFFIKPKNSINLGAGLIYHL
jgi:hypothetical protein